MDEQKKPNQPAGQGDAQPQGVGGKLKERTAKIRQQANQAYEEKKGWRQRRKEISDEEEVEYYYDDDAASRRAGIGCLIAFLVALAIVIGVVLYGWNWYKAETGGGHATATGVVEITLPTGSGASTVGTTLEDNGLIGNSMVFRLYARYITDDPPSFKAGTFEVEAGLGYDEIIELLSSAEALPDILEVEVKEGVTIMAVANEFEMAGFGTAEEFLATANNLENFSDITFIAKYLEDFDSSIVFHAAEGLMFPAKYEFYEGTSTEDIVRSLYENTDSKFTQEMYDQMGEMGLSLREFMTLASLVQAESGHASDDPSVAGVFLNRLASDNFEYLDSDVTLRYVKQWMQWNLEEFAERTHRDIGYPEAREAVGDTLYSSYVTTIYFESAEYARAGLPAGPICSVSLNTIEATLSPAEHDYYFFVTYPYFEGNETKYMFLYATTSAEHDANVIEADAMTAQYEQEVVERDANGEGAGEGQPAANAGDEGDMVTWDPEDEAGDEAA